MLIQSAAELKLLWASNYDSSAVPLTESFIKQVIEPHGNFLCVWINFRSFPEQEGVICYQMSAAQLWRRLEGGSVAYGRALELFVYLWRERSVPYRMSTPWELQLLLSIPSHYIQWFFEVWLHYWATVPKATTWKKNPIASNKSYFWEHLLDCTADVGVLQIYRLPFCLEIKLQKL